MNNCIGLWQKNTEQEREKKRHGDTERGGGRGSGLQESVAGNEMCYLGELEVIVWGGGFVFTPISALQRDFNAALHCRLCQRAMFWRGQGREEGWRKKWWSEQKRGKKWVQKNGRRRRKIQEMATRKENKEMERERATNEVKAWRCGQSEKCKK